MNRAENQPHVERATLLPVAAAPVAAPTVRP